MKKIIVTLLCACILLPVCACGNSSGYKVIDTYSEAGSFVIAFRKDDRICEVVSAAMRELADSGVLRSTSLKWFGENLVSLKGEKNALEGIKKDIGQRTITVGVDITNMPMSYETEEGYLGFDVDIANYICSYLGWNMLIYPIDPVKVDVELQSGNIDMAMGIAEKDETDSFSYSPAYLTSRYVLVARVSGQVKDRSALKGRTLGVAVTDLDVLQQDEKFVESLGAVIYQTNTDGLFQALLNREVDGILVSSVVAAYYMNL